MGMFTNQGLKANRKICKKQQKNDVHVHAESVKEERGQERLCVHAHVCKSKLYAGVHGRIELN